MPPTTKRNHCYSCFFPVFGLEVGRDLGHEIEIGRVTFVDAQSVLRRRRRFQIHREPGYYRKSKYWREKLFSESATYALVRNRRDPDSNRFDSERRMARDALMIVASTFRVTSPRGRFEASMRPPVPDDLVESAVAFRHKSPQWTSSLSCFRPTSTYKLDALWMKNARESGFFRFLRLINGGKSSVSDSWTTALRRSAVLHGRSYVSHDLFEAFILNMIAIECLLCKRGDKFSDLFPKRLTSLFGWLDEDNRDTWSKIAERLYSLRCSLVHDGLSGDITVADLLNSDAVLGNLQDNIWMNLTRFPTKDSLLRYLDEVQARHLLGMRVWRKKDNLVFHHRPITDRQIILLEEYFEVGA